MGSNFFRGTSLDQVGPSKPLPQPRTAADWSSSSLNPHQRRNSRTVDRFAHALVVLLVLLSGCAGYRTQDPRFKDKQSALLRKTQFPPSFDTKVSRQALRFRPRRSRSAQERPVSGDHTRRTLADSRSSFPGRHAQGRGAFSVTADRACQLQLTLRISSSRWAS